MKKFSKIFVKLIFNLVTILISSFIGFQILEFGVDNGWIKSHIESNQVFVEIAWFVILSTAIYFLIYYNLRKLLSIIIFFGIFCPILWIGCNFFNWPIPPTYRKDGSIDYHDDNN